MKKLLSVIAALALLLGLCACGSGEFDANHAITVVSRESGSGTRGAFVELFGIEQKDETGEKVDYTTVEAQVTNNTSVMFTTVAGNRYAIGYVSLGSLNDTVKTVMINGVAPTAAGVADGSYRIARPFMVATKGGLSAAAADFMAFILSDEGQRIVTENGYIAVESAGAYAGAGSGKVVVAGSSSVTPVMEKLAEAYEARNGGAEIEVQQSDSTTGMMAVAEGACDIGMASRALKDSELAGGLTPATIAMDGIAVIVSNDCPVVDLTADEVRGIFTGETTSWAGLAD